MPMEERGLDLAVVGIERNLETALMGLITSVPKSSNSADVITRAGGSAWL
jgi:hypothetical protein